MSQTLQQSLLSCKSMNGIISFDDGAGTTISNGQVTTGNITSSGAVSSNSLTVTTLTCTATATVPTVPVGDISPHAASTQFVENYFLAAFVQELTQINTLLDPTSYVDVQYVNQGIADSVVTLIRLPNENTFATPGIRFKIFPTLPWSSLASSITVNTVTGSTFICNGVVVSSITMTANNPSIEVICIDTGATGFCWSVTYRDPLNLLSSNNIWTNSNTFSNLTYSNISTILTLTNADFTIPFFANATTNIWTTSTVGATYSITGWNYLFNTLVTSGVQLFVNNNSTSPFYFTYYPTASNCCSILLTGFGDECIMTSSNYTLVAGEYEVSFYLQCQVDQVNLNVDFSVKTSGGTVLSYLNGLNPASAYPAWIKYELAFNFSTTTTVNFVLAMKSGYVAITGFSLRLTNAIQVTDGTTLTSIGAKQSILNDVAVQSGLVVLSGGVNAIGGLNCGTTYGTSNTVLNSNMSSSIGYVNTSCIGIGKGSLDFANGALRTISLGDWSAYASAPQDDICIGLYNNLSGNYSVAIGNNIATVGTTGYNTLVGYGIGNRVSGGDIGNYNSVLGAESFQQYNGFGTLLPSYNTSCGYQSQYQTGDWYNTSCGAQSLYSITGDNGLTLTTQYNSALGYQSGFAYNGINNCTFLGAKSDVTVANLTNVTCVGYNTKCGTSNTIQLGSNSEAVRITGPYGSSNQTFTSNNQTISLTGPKLVYVNSNAATNLYLPQPSASDIGKIFTVIKGGGTATWGLTLNRAVATTFTIQADGVSTNTSYTMQVSEYSVNIVVTNSTTTGICYTIYYNNPTTIKSETVFTNPFFLPAQSNVPATKSSINSIVIGTNALIGIGTGAFVNSNVVIGADAGKLITSNPSALCIIGREAFGQSTALGSGNTSLGYRSGYTQTTGASTNCTFLGANTAVSVATTAYTQSTAVGYSATISASNQCVLATSTETVYVPGTFQVQNNYIASASPTIITTTTTLSGVLYRYYSVTSAAAYSITLPAAAVGYLGCRVTFRRVGATITNAVTSASANIFPLNSITAANTLLAASVCQVTISCMLTAVGVYNWVVTG